MLFKKNPNIGKFCNKRIIKRNLNDNKNLKDLKPLVNNIEQNLIKDLFDNQNYWSKILDRNKEKNCGLFQNPILKEKSNLMPLTKETIKKSQYIVNLILNCDQSKDQNILIITLYKSIVIITDYD